MNEIDQAVEFTLRIGTPILFAGLGEVLVERAGVINIGIEGVMLTGAFCGFAVGWLSGSPVLGALAGMLGGAILMSLFALIVLKFSADQIVTGMAINLAALGITGTAYLAITQKHAGATSTVFKPMAENLRDVPLLGPLLFSQTILTWIALLLIPLIWWYLQKSERGLELRAVGENPAAAEASGIDVRACRWKACIAAGMLCGLGGAFLTVSQTASFANNMTRGRGYVALAAVVLGRYGSIGTAAACLFFGAAFYSRDAFPAAQIPTDVVEMLPYALALLVLTFKSQKRSAPAALGKPYQR
jgi:general nucleoside transport system permease protein